MELLEGQRDSEGFSVELADCGRVVLRRGGGDELAGLLEKNGKLRVLRKGARHPLPRSITPCDRWRETITSSI